MDVAWASQSKFQASFDNVFANSGTSDGKKNLFVRIRGR